MNKFNEAAVVSHGRLLIAQDRMSDYLSSRMRIRDEQGDVTPRMVGAAVMAAAAIAVFGVIATRLQTKAETLPLE